MASPGFHLQHITGVIDRLFTYAEGEALSQVQMDYLHGEGKSTQNQDSVAYLLTAFSDIVDNAVKYTDKGGVIINIKEPESKPNHIMIIVCDTGIGIDKEDLNKLFGKVFERGETAQKTFATGRGIGLYISNQIIKAHQGTITVESEGRDRGSTFTIDLKVGSI